MRRFLPYILIVFTLVNFLAPVSIGLSNTNKIVVNKNVASAAGFDATLTGYQGAFSSSSLQAGAIYIDESHVKLDITAKIDTGLGAGTDSANNWLHVKSEASATSNVLSGLTWGLVGTDYREFKKSNALVIKFVESDTNKIGLLDVSNNFWTMSDADKIPYGQKRQT